MLIGFSYVAISRAACDTVTTSGLRKCCCRYHETRSIQKEEENERKKCTAAADDKIIKQIIFRGRRISSVAINSELGASGVFLHAKTVRERLTEVVLKGRIPIRKPMLNKSSSTIVVAEKYI